MLQQNGCGRLWPGRQARCRVTGLWVRRTGAGAALLAALAIVAAAGSGPSSLGAHAITTAVTAGTLAGQPQPGPGPANTGCCA